MDSVRKAKTRLHVLEVAEQLIAELGYATVSPADVSAAARMGRTTFYEYFADMEDLLCALVEKRLPEVTAEMTAGVPHDVSCREQMSELAVRLVEFAVNDHALGIELHQGLPSLSRVAQERIADAHRELSGEFARIYRCGVDAGEFREIPSNLAGLFVQDLIMAAAKSLIRLPEPKAKLHEVADELTTFLFAGLSPT